MRPVDPERTVLSSDERFQRVVLDLLMEAHPGQLHVDEIERAVNAETDSSFAGRDRVEIALRDLVAYGLAHRHGSFMFATRTVMRAWWLDP